MKILVMRTCGVEDGLEDADFGLAKLDKDLVGRIKKGVALAKSVKEKDDSFFTMDLRMADCIAFVSADTLEKMGLELADGKSHAVKSGDLDALLEGKDTERVDGTHLTVCEDSFWFTCSPKYGDACELGNRTTEAISAKELANLEKAIR